MEDRLEKLEIKITYLEETVAELDRIVIEKLSEIEKLKSEITALKDNLVLADEIRPSEKPPHY